MQHGDNLIAMTQLEVSTVKLTKKLSKLTKLLRSAKDDKALRSAVGKFPPYVQYINDALRNITEDLENRNLTIIDSPHLNYFLLNVAKFNTLFFKLHEKHVMDSETQSPLLTLLQDLKLEPFNHPLLGAANHTDFSYQHRVASTKRFRDPIKKHQPAFMRRFYDRERFFYDENQASDNYDGTGLSFPEFYGQANKKIGKQTQVTNLKNYFHKDEPSQLKDSFWRAKDISQHKYEKAIFKAAMKKTRKGLPLTVTERKLFDEGDFYRGTGACMQFSLPSQPHHNILKSDKPEVFFNGHATVGIKISDLIFTFDPINGPCNNKLMYGRHTKAGIRAKDYFTHVVPFSHNHYDHLDKQTVIDAWAGLNPLFVAPKGDGELLRSWGFQHVVEFESWNDSLEIEVASNNGQKTTVTLYAFPAKHASNREIHSLMPDINTSLFMGYMLREEGADHVTLVTGDTAVLDEEHFAQLEKFSLENDVTISTACIASGPDRPRSHLECTHQSTADAITMNTRLNVINAKVQAKRFKDPYSLMSAGELHQTDCHAILYHQGCFRLGVLNYADVEGTVTRMIAALKQYPDNQSLGYIIADIKQQKTILDALKHHSSIDKNSLSNLPFALMDEFEREGLIQTLEAYASLTLSPDAKLKNKHIIKHICEHAHLPKPGQILDFNQEDNEHFTYEYKNLVVNRDVHLGRSRAYSDIMHALANNHSLDSISNNKKLVKEMLTAYLSVASGTKKKQAVQAYLSVLDTQEALSEEKLINSLIRLRGEIKNWQTNDETQRDEGKFETTILMVFGCLRDDAFKQKLMNDYSWDVVSNMCTRFLDSRASNHFVLDIWQSFLSGICNIFGVGYETDKEKHIKFINDDLSKTVRTAIYNNDEDPLKTSIAGGLSLFQPATQPETRDLLDQISLRLTGLTT